MKSDARTAWIIVVAGFLCAVVLGIGAVALSSWLVDSGDRAIHVPEFDRAQTQQDIVGLPSEHLSIELESTRFVGDVDGYGIYIAQAIEGDGICIVLWETDTDQWQSTGCGGPGGVATILPSGTAVGIGDNFAPSIDGERSQLSESVVVITD